MFDTINGTIKVVIISSVILLISLVASYKINYTKAVKVNDKIISQYEKYSGDCDLTSQCHEEIMEYMKDIGYVANNLKRKADFICENGYCHKELEETTKEKTYEIITQVNINMPIVNKILPYMETFQVLNETKPITMDGDK